MAFDRFFVRLGRHLLTSFACRLRHCRLTDVCILSTGQTKVNRFSRKPIKVYRNSRFANENAGKKIVVFWLGGYLLVDPVAIGVSRRPNWPMLAGLLKLVEGYCVGEFVD